jgi:hypothetical protein
MQLTKSNNLMPLPIPSADESEQDFVSRFMGDAEAVSKFPEETQRSAVAYSTYRDEEMEEMELGGVSILEVGEAKGHDLFVDKTSLKTALKLMGSAKNGVKVKMNHGSGLDAVVGFARNPRIEGDKLVADLRLLRNSPHYGLIKEMASEAPDQFGVSLAFVNESETIDGKDYIRPQSIASADLVSSPAATNGLFQEIVKFMENVKEFRCWEGYKPAKGVKPYETGSCVKAQEKLGYISGGKTIPAVAKETVEEAPLDKKDKSNMENTDYKKDMDEVKVRLAALEEAMKPKEEVKKEEMKSEEAPKIVIEKEDDKEDNTEEMSAVVKKVLTEFGIKPIPASPSIEVPSEKKEEPKTFEALVAAHSDYGTSKLKAMKAVMLSNPKEYSEALSRGITKL